MKKKEKIHIAFNIKKIMIEVKKVKQVTGYMMVYNDTGIIIDFMMIQF